MGQILDECLHHSYRLVSSITILITQHQHQGIPGRLLKERIQADKCVLNSPTRSHQEPSFTCFKVKIFQNLKLRLLPLFVVQKSRQLEIAANNRG
jgi:hypothetical protein